MTEVKSGIDAGRKPVRAPIREGEIALRPGEYQGRNGEVLKRAPTLRGNPFDLPEEIKEAGWSYQWIRASCYGNTEMSEMSVMKRAGWREVPPDALHGYFRDETPEGQNFISREGLVLMERPQAMTDEARQEDLRLANVQYGRQLQKIYDETYQMPDGFVPTSQLDREHLQAAPSAWKPAHRPRPVALEE
jgi:hypothetical protein